MRKKIDKGRVFTLPLSKLKVGDVVKIITSDYTKCVGCIKIITRLGGNFIKGVPVSLRGHHCHSGTLVGEEGCVILQGETLTNILTDEEIVEVLKWKLIGRK